MTRRKFRTPPTLPEDTQCRGLIIPSSKEWLGLYSDAILELTKPYNYTQVEATDLTPTETAALVYAQYEDWLQSTCDGTGEPCPPVELPDGTRVYRRNPETNRIEYMNPETGQWVEPSGTETLPSPTARSESTAEDRKCAAATNAVECLRATLESVLDEWNALSEPAQAITTMVTGIVGWAGAAFYPPMVGFVLLAEAAFNLFYEAFDAITWNFWDSEFERALICCFKKNATDAAGVVTFNYDTIVNEIWQQLWTRGEYVLLVAQVQYLLSIIGPQGLDMAGTATAKTGNCASLGCDSWCYTFYDLNVVTVATGTRLGYGSVRAVYIGSGWWYADIYVDVDTTNATIVKVGTTLSQTGTTTSYYRIRATPATGLDTGSVTKSTGVNGSYYTAGPPDVSTSSLTRVRIELQGASEVQRDIHTLQMYGTGINPFGLGSNCT